MSEYNPYAIPDDADADILGETPQRKHALDGSVCPSCGIAHELESDQDLPEEVLDKLAEFLDGVPAGAIHSKITVARSTPGHNHLMQDFINFAQELEKVAREAPLLRALAETVDELSGGQVQRLWRVYQSERELMIGHILVKSVNRMLDLRAPGEAQTEPTTETKMLVELLETLQAASIERIQKAAELYRLRAGETGVPVDEQLIETGVFSDEHEVSHFREGMETLENATDILKKL